MTAWNNEAFTVTWDGNPIGEASLTEEGVHTIGEMAAQLALYGEPVDEAYMERWRAQALIRWSDEVERRIEALVMRAKLRSAHQRARLSTQTRRRGRR